MSAGSSTPDGAPNRKVLVTGAGGFIGRHLTADQLARGHAVVALDRDLGAVRHMDSARLTLLEGDVGDPALVDRAVRDVDTVFHLAAAHLGASTPKAEFHRINVGAVQHLVSACRTAGVRRFVHCSTVGVYGKLEHVPADEETACAPEFDYERTKLEGERVLLDAHRASDFPVVVLRPGWVYGPGCPRTDKLFRAIGSGRFVVAGNGRALRHSVYIRDTVDAFQLAADADDVGGEVMLIADDGAVSIRTLVDEIAALTGARRPRSIPFSALYLAGLAAELVFTPLGKEPPVSRRTLRFFSGNTSFRTDRARRLLGFRPRYSIAAGLAETDAIRRSDAFWSVPMPSAPLEA